MVWRVNPPDHDQQRSNCHAPMIKPEAPSAVYAPDDGWGGARNMLSHTHKRQVINLWNCCILLVDLFELYDDAWTCKCQISPDCKPDDKNKIINTYMSDIIFCLWYILYTHTWHIRSLSCLPMSDYYCTNKFFTFMIFVFMLRGEWPLTINSDF